MNDSPSEQNAITASDRAYRDAVFEALMNYQAIEELLRDCIIKSYEILDATSHETVSLKPSGRHIENVRKKMGLGSLVETFKTLTANRDLCERILTESRTRNLVAHKAASEYLKFPISDNGARDCQEKALNIYEAAQTANWLYFELVELHNQISEVHGQTV